MSIQSCLKGENDTDSWTDKANLLNKDVLGLSDNLQRQCESIVFVILRGYYGDTKLIAENVALLGRKEFKCVSMYYVLNCPFQYYLFNSKPGLQMRKLRPGVFKGKHNLPKYMCTFQGENSMGLEKEYRLDLIKA